MTRYYNANKEKFLNISSETINGLWEKFNSGNGEIEDLNNYQLKRGENGEYR